MRTHVRTDVLRHTLSLFTTQSVQKISHLQVHSRRCQKKRFKNTLCYLHLMQDILVQWPWRIYIIFENYENYIWGSWKNPALILRSHSVWSLSNTFLLDSDVNDTGFKMLTSQKFDKAQSRWATEKIIQTKTEQANKLSRFTSRDTEKSAYNVFSQ